MGVLRRYNSKPNWPSIFKEIRFRKARKPAKSEERIEMERFAPPLSVREGEELRSQEPEETRRVKVLVEDLGIRRGLLGPAGLRCEVTSIQFLPPDLMA